MNDRRSQYEESDYAYFKHMLEMYPNNRIAPKLKSILKLRERTLKIKKIRNNVLCD